MGTEIGPSLVKHEFIMRGCSTYPEIRCSDLPGSCDCKGCELSGGVEQGTKDAHFERTCVARAAMPSDQVIVSSLVLARKRGKRSCVSISVTRPQLAEVFRSPRTR